MADNVRTYLVRFTDGVDQQVEAENYRYVTTHEGSSEPLPTGLGRVEFTRDDRPVMTVNATAVVSIRERG